MTNNKAREVNNPIIEELINETTAQELALIDTDMRSYAEGYKEGYKRALELVEFGIELVKTKK
jgi:hypothetical protein